MADLPMSKIESGIENRKPNQSEIFSLSVGRKNHAVHSITAARTLRKGLSSPELDLSPQCRRLGTADILRPDHKSQGHRTIP